MFVSYSQDNHRVVAEGWSPVTERLHGLPHTHFVADEAMGEGTRVC